MKTYRKLMRSFYAVFESSKYVGDKAMFEDYVDPMPNAHVIKALTQKHKMTKKQAETVAAMLAAIDRDSKNGLDFAQMVIMDV